MEEFEFGDLIQRDLDPPRVGMYVCRRPPIGMWVLILDEPPADADDMDQQFHIGSWYLADPSCWSPA